MAQALPKPLPDFPKKVGKSRKVNRNRSLRQNARADAASLASALQLQEEKRDLIYSSIALLMKLGFFVIAISSLFNLAIASHHRVRRNFELSSLLDLESKKNKELYFRFDKLFTIGGKQRLLDEHDQWIEPNRVRVIWR